MAILRAVSLLFAALLLVACSRQQEAAQTPVPVGMLPDGATPLHYRLALEIIPENDRFSGTAEIDVEFAEPRNSLFLHGLDLNVTEAQVTTAGGESIPARYAQVHDSGVARLHFESTVPAGRGTLHFRYDAAFNTALAGLYKITDRGDAYVFSQLEPIRARRIFPSFDEPRFKTPFDTTITTRAEHRVVSNTTPRAEEMLENGLKRISFATTLKLPTYLLAFAVGPLDIVAAPPIPPNEVRDRPLPLRAVTGRGKGERMRYALRNTPEIVAQLERYFGVPYAFDKLDIIAAPDFAAGAMENAGAIVYRETLMLMDESAPLNQRRGYAYVHAHELAHQWFGNLVTPRWWDDIWLNEAFATWLGNSAAAEWFPYAEFSRENLRDSLWVMGLDSLPSARRIHEPVNNADDIANAFDGITYSKGAGVLAMFESYLGKEAFREGVRLHMQRFPFGTASTADFLKALADGSQRPEVLPSFTSFIDQPGVPAVTVRPVCGNGERIALSQASYTPIGVTPAARRWQIPACLRPANGAKHCVMLSDATAEIDLPGACTDAVMPNAGGQGYYRFDLDADGWRRLIGAHERLDAAEQIVLLDNLDASVRAGRAPAALLFEALDAIVPRGAWDSVDRATGVLASLGDTVVSDETREHFEARARALIAPHFTRLRTAQRDSEPAADTLLRHSAAWFLIRTAGDAALRATLARDGELYIRSGGRERGALSPDLLVDAMWSAVRENETQTVPALISALAASDDAEFRRSTLVALSAAQDPALLERIHALMLSPELRNNETVLLLGNLLDDPARFAGAWTWIKGNIAGLEQRLQTNRMAGVISRLGTACDAATRSDVESFFRPKLQTYTGSPRALALTLESIDRCIAFKQAEAGEINTAIRAWD